MIRKVIEEAPLSVASLAEEAGLSTASLYAWAKENRNATSENLRALADALERHSSTLRELAEQLRQEAGE